MAQVTTAKCRAACASLQRSVIMCNGVKCSSSGRGLALDFRGRCEKRSLPSPAEPWCGRVPRKHNTAVVCSLSCSTVSQLLHQVLEHKMQRS